MPVLRAVTIRASSRLPAAVAAILDNRTLRSAPESGHRAGYDGAKRKKGSKVHLMHVAPADEQDRARVDELARAVQEASARAWSRPSGTEA